MRVGLAASGGGVEEKHDAELEVQEFSQECEELRLRQRRKLSFLVRGRRGDVQLWARLFQLQQRVLRGFQLLHELLGGILVLVIQYLARTF